MQFIQLELKLQKTVELTYLEANKQQTTYHLTYSEVSKCYVFSGDKLRNKMPLVYSECKLEKDRCDRCIFNLKCWKTIETNMFTEKQTTNKVAKTFFHVKAVTERKK